MQSSMCRFLYKQKLPSILKNAFYKMNLFLFSFSF